MTCSSFSRTIMTDPMADFRTISGEGDEPARGPRRPPAILEHFQQKCEAVLRPEMLESEELEHFRRECETEMCENQQTERIKPYATYKSDSLMMDGKKQDHGAIPEAGPMADLMDPNNQIGVRLRSLYAAVQDEVIPDRFLDLLEQLDRVERMAATKTANE